MTIFLSVLASNNSARSPICILYINSGIYICMCVYITILFTNHPRMYTHAFILVVSILCVFEGTLHTFFLDKKRRKALSSARSDFIVDTAGNISAERFTLSFARARSFHLSLSLFPVFTAYSSALPPPLSSPVVHSSRKSLAASRYKSSLTFPPRWSP
jgi:hypothetical protein